MGILNSVKNFVFQKGYDEEYYDDINDNDDYSYENDEDVYSISDRRNFSRNSEAKKNDTIAIPRRNQAKAEEEESVYTLGAITNGHKIVISSPKNIDEASTVCDCLKDGKTVIVNLEGVDTKDSQRIMDFISGVTYAVRGDVQPISTRIFCVTPKDVEVTEHLKEQLKANGIFPSFGLKSVFSK